MRSQEREFTEPKERNRQAKGAEVRILKLASLVSAEFPLPGSTSLVHFCPQGTPIRL